MQLNTYKISLATASILFSNTLLADNYIRVNYMQYNENDNRITVKAPSFELNNDFGVDYTLNIKLIADGVSGGTPIYVDSTSSGTPIYVDSTSSGTPNTRVELPAIRKQNVLMSEKRQYGSASLITRFANRDELTTSFSKSYESDYDAKTLSVGYLHWDGANKNRSFDIGFSYQSNNILSYSIDTTSSASKKETSTAINTEVGITQIIDKTSLAKVSLFYGKEDGYLSNPYKTIVRNNQDISLDIRPNKRVGYGFSLKYIKALSNTLSTHYKYRYYNDDWSINSNTIDINSYYEITSEYTMGLGFRYYAQDKAKFYNNNSNYFTNEKFASSDERLSKFNSKTYKLTFDYKYDKNLSYNLGINKYIQDTGLEAVYSSIGVKYSF